MRHGQLEFGAFDLLLTGEDDYTFLEVNPVGDWRWLESRHHGLDGPVGEGSSGEPGVACEELP